MACPLLLLLLMLVSFLVVLNGFLRGAAKARIDVGLSVALIGLLVGTWVAAGVAGLLTGIFAVMLTAVVSRPFAARAASALFRAGSGRPGTYPGLPRRALRAISAALGRQYTPEEIMQVFRSGSSRKELAEEELLEHCESDGAVRQVIDEFAVTREDLRSLYYQLLSLGAGQWAAGHWVAASALAYPDTLRYLLGRRASGQVDLQVAFELIMHFERGLPAGPGQ